jgi:hypothetical protein
MREMMKRSEEQGNLKYIHLQNVVIYPSDYSHPLIADVWRGKLLSVDGFSLGQGPLQVKFLDDK